MDDFKMLIRREGKFDIPEAELDMLLDNMEESYIPAKTHVIEVGKINTNVYLIKEGIFRVSYLSGDREVTYGFGEAGSFFLSPHSFYMNKPAFMQVDTCKTGGVVMHMTRDRFYTLMNSSHVFAQWMFDIAMYQIFGCEFKISMINGTAKERYLSMIKNRPEVLRYISKKNIASYLDVTPEYLSRISVDV